MTICRPATWFLSLCLFISGCTSAARWAEKSRERLAPGMSPEDVREEIGEPSQIVRGDAGQPEIWRYSFESHAGTLATIVAILIIIPLIVVMVLGRSGGSINMGGSGGSEPGAEFTVDFDAQGRVVGISPIRILDR